ncbi:MAG: hypothetical protein EB059_08520, partial [Alphaproteobacteria bacterium]|nr:hypothetical protein [Alphaproteobacteria bacterium]
ACVGRISAALSGLGDKVDVTLNPPRAVIESAEPLNDETVSAALTKAGSYSITTSDTGSWLNTYYPLFLIIGLIALAACRAETMHGWMLNFMAGFFIVFGFFKLLDLRGFRDAYKSYDLLAARWNNYGLIYPFLELALGFAFLFQYQLTFALYASILLMGFSSLGVIKALRAKQSIRCACLGTVLQLPMSTITLIEDLGMVLMSALMLAVKFST